MDARMPQEDARYTKTTMLDQLREYRECGYSWPRAIRAYIDLRGHTAWKLNSLAAVVQHTANRLDDGARRPGSGSARP